MLVQTIPVNVTDWSMKAAYEADISNIERMNDLEFAKKCALICIYISACMVCSLGQLHLQTFK
jgi:mannose/fructose/N-acetylgalactosamine-specific phosphotransferase system component IIC